MNYFTAENTNGFSADELKKMNKMLENKMAEIDENDPDYEQYVKHYSDQISDSMKQEYCVIRITEYYQGDVQHPKGVEADVETFSDENGESPMIGTLEECQKWEDGLNSRNIYLGHGEAGKYWVICQIEDDDADYQSWLDSRDWEGCPSEDKSDHDANCQWAEEKSIRAESAMIVQYPDFHKLMIVSKI